MPAGRKNWASSRAAGSIGNCAGRALPANARPMGILAKIFTWWDGATIGTAMFSAFNGEHVGTDAQGNKYYRSKKRGPDGRERRWVIYDGINDSSRVPAESIGRAP